MSTPQARRIGQADARSVEALRVWLASPSGQKRMQQAAHDAEKARAEIEKSARVPPDVLRAPMTL